MKLLIIVALCFLVATVTASPFGRLELMKSDSKPLKVVHPTLKGTPFIDCGSKGAVKLFLANNCTTSPCGVQRLHNASIEIEFVPNVQVTALTIKIEAYLGPLPVPFKFPQPDACQGQGLTCPLAAGSDDTFKSQLLIPSEATAGLALKLKWEMIDQDKNNQVCVEFAVKVES